MNFELNKIDNYKSVIGKEIRNLEAYEYLLNNKVIGYLFLNSEHSSRNNFYMKIMEDYQSNGYGKKLFKDVMSLLSDRNYKEIFINVEADNTRMINILKQNNSFELSTIHGIKEFIVKVG